MKPGYDCEYCKRCGLVSEGNRNNFMPMTQGSNSNSILVVGEAPGANEDRVGRQFVGKSGKKLREILDVVLDGEHSSGITMDDVAFTNACRCRPPKNATPSVIQINSCRHFLYQDILEADPILLIAVGTVPVKALINKTIKIGNTHGTIERVKVTGVDSNGEDIVRYYPCLITYHPAATFYSKHITPEDIGRDIIAGVNLINVKQSGVETDYVLVDNEHKLAKCKKEMLSAEWIAFDIETTGLSPFLDDDPRVLGVSLSVAKNKAYFIPVDHDESPWKTKEEDLLTGVVNNNDFIIGELKDILENDIPKVGHNVKFDCMYLKAALDINPTNVEYDTMLAYYMLDERHRATSLKDLAVLYTNIPNYEDPLYIYFDKELGGKREFGKVPLNELYKYACGDTDATLQVMHKLDKEFENLIDDKPYTIFKNLMMPASDMLADVECNGMHTDFAYLLNVQRQFEDAEDELRRRVYKFESVQKCILEHHSVFAKNTLKIARNIHALAGQKFTLHQIYDTHSRMFNVNKGTAPDKKAKYKCLQNILGISDEIISIYKKQRRAKLKAARNEVAYTGEDIGSTETVVITKEYIDFIVDNYKEEVKLGSSKKKAEILFDFERLPPVKFTEAEARSTDKETLEELANVDSMMLNVLEYEKYIDEGILDDGEEIRGSKLALIFLIYSIVLSALSKSLRTLPKFIDEDERVHSTFNLAFTVTGRLSSSNPNLQNIASDKRVKNIFCVPEGYQLLQADLSQAELRVLAVTTMDKNLIELYKRGDDIHSTVASAIFNKPPHEITKDERRRAKTLNFGMIYGMMESTYATRAGISIDEARDMYNRFYGQFPGVSKWHKYVVSKAQDEGIVRSVVGRIRHTFEATQAMNMPIQSAASDLFILSVNELHQFIHNEWEHSGVKIVNLVHDAVYLEVPNHLVKEAAIVTNNFMETPMIQSIIDSGVPIVSDLELGERWGSLKPLWVIDQDSDLWNNGEDTYIDNVRLAEHEEEGSLYVTTK